MDMLTSDVLGAPGWFWIVFAGLIAGVLLFDLGYLNRKIPILSFGQSVALTAGYACIAVLFGLGVWWWFGPDMGAIFFTAYVVEQSLSIDNVFVMSVIFAFFKVPREHQHRVLFWGIIVAIVLRALFVGFGTAVVSKFEWILYLFGAFLIFTGIRMLFGGDDDEHDLSQNRFVGFLQRHLNVTTDIHGHHFFVRLPDSTTGKVALFATPLFMSFAVINLADIVFAVDSVPAVLSMTQDLFIVYTSNIFAILGLRALYFVIDALIARFHLLKYALAVLLILIGAMIFYEKLVGEFDNLLMLGITLGILLLAIVASAVFPKKDDAEPTHAAGHE